MRIQFIFHLFASQSTCDLKNSPAVRFHPCSRTFACTISRSWTTQKCPITSHESQVFDRAMRLGLRVRRYMIRLEGLTIYWCETNKAPFSQLFEDSEWSIETTTTIITITLFTHGKKRLNRVDITDRQCFIEFKIPNFVNWSCDSSLEKIINKFPLFTLGRIYSTNASGVKNPNWPEVN